MGMFRKAERRKVKLRIGLDGPSGSGKTFSAILIAKGLANGKPIGMIDTERGSGEMYPHLCDYSVVPLTPPFRPERYIEAIKAAEQEGFAVLIIDSLTHAWAGEGGILDLHDAATKASRSKNSYTAWREITPMHNQLVDTILQSPLHIIVTLRTKTAYEIVEENGKKKPIKVGLAPIQKDGIEYEFTVVFDLSIEGHIATSSKDRTSLFDGEHFVPTEETGKQLVGWLDSAADVPAPQPPTATRQEKQKTAQQKADKESNGAWAKSLWRRAEIAGMTQETMREMAQDLGITDSGKATEDQKASLKTAVDTWLMEQEYKQVTL